jgi:uncharacterized protein YutE (UPF0331/DUF86 family)
MINGIILQKLQTLEEVLQELRSLGYLTTQQLNDDWRIQRAVERDLQILAEVVIDVCQRLLSLADQTPATTGADAIERCVKLGVLTSVDPYRRMVQFRNFIVHRYEKIDVTILVDVVNRRLGDFEQFKREVLSYARR